MIRYRIDLNELHWESPMRGLRFKAFQHQGRQLRLVVGFLLSRRQLRVVVGFLPGRRQLLQMAEHFVRVRLGLDLVAVGEQVLDADGADDGEEIRVRE